MAKDDFHVIVYQILAYLYQRLKNGEPVDVKMLLGFINTKETEQRQGSNGTIK